jgi:hypothetical protein
MGYRNYGRLRLDNIRLDIVGHVTICDFGLHAGPRELPTNDEEVKRIECPPPEMLLGQELTKASGIDGASCNKLIY